METFEALYTTRAMRRVKPDPIPEDVVKQMLDAAIRAPSPGNVQQWRFVAVTDPTVIEQLGILYERWQREMPESFCSSRAPSSSMPWQTPLTL